MTPEPVQRRNYALPPVDRQEVLRYARAGQSPDEATRELLEAVILEAASEIAGRVCFWECPVVLEPPKVLFGAAMTATSEGLCRNLAECDQALLFGATIGLGMDRLVAKYGRVAPARALFCQALGAERIEALCDCFCQDIAREKAPAGWHLRPRFSPGYGDLPLEFQKTLFSVLDAPRQIGLSLNESLLMSPSKSVTAIVGLSRKPRSLPHASCSACGMRADCPYSPNEQRS